MEQKEIAGKILIVQNFPDDVLLGIFWRLPDKALYRFRSVCTSWNSLLSSNFIRPQDKNTKLLLCFDEYYSILDSYETTYDSDHANLPIAEPVGYPFNDSLVSMSVDIELMAYCNNWFLLSDRRGNRLWLLNPSTEEYKAFQCYGDRRFSPLLYGICFDGSQNQQKVVIVGNLDGFESQFFTVFSFETKSWTVIEEFPYSARFIPFLCSARFKPKQGVSVNGIPHWVCQDHLSWCVIVGFDMKKKKKKKKKRFVEVPKPIVNGYYHNAPLLLAALGHNLFVFLNNYSTIRIWEMKEYGVKESWVQVFRIVTIGIDLFMPMAITKKGELIILSSDRKKLVIYNQKKMTSKTLLTFMEPRSISMLPYLDC